MLKTESQGISESQGIPLMLETIREVSEKMFVFLSSINRFLCVREKHMPILRLFVFIFHDVNRAHSV